jgi:hypothetical protein
MNRSPIISPRIAADTEHAATSPAPGVSTRLAQKATAFSPKQERRQPPSQSIGAAAFETAEPEEIKPIN